MKLKRFKACVAEKKKTTGKERRTNPEIMVKYMREGSQKLPMFMFFYLLNVKINKNKK